MVDDIFRIVIEKELISLEAIWFQARRLFSLSAFIDNPRNMSFENGFEVKGVFLDISKAFNKV